MKKKIYNIISIFMALCILLTLKFDSIKPVFAVNNFIDERYGITYANIDTFGYYEFKPENGTKSPEDTPPDQIWSTFGGGLDATWRLPAEAKEGDYFTLKFGDKLRLKKAPMYADNEIPEYARLDKVGNRYPVSITNNYDNPNIFFIIRDRYTQEPILNVYYTKLGELTFVVQKYANDKGVLEGNAVIGERIKPEYTLAITDGNGRHVRKKDYGDFLNEKVDLDYQFSKYAFYTGFEPNFLYMRPDNDANTIPTTISNDAGKYWVAKNMTYTTSYMGGAERELVDGYKKDGGSEGQGLFINYKTFLLKNWGLNGKRSGLVSFGDIALLPAYEDRSFIYYYLIYQANKGQTTSKGPQKMFIQGEANNLHIEDIQTFEGYDANYSKKEGLSLAPLMTYFPENFIPKNRVGTIPQDKDFKPTKKAGEWSRTFSYFSSDRTKTYFSIVTARKITPITTYDPVGKPKYVMSMYSENLGNVLNVVNNDYYVITSGLGESSTDVRSFDDRDSLKLKKVNSSKNKIESEIIFDDNNARLKDDYGNIYHQGREGVYVDQEGRELSQLKENNKLIYLDGDGNKIQKDKEGDKIVYVDTKNNIRYYEDSANPKQYKSKDGKVFKPYRPVLVINSMKLTVNTSGSGSVANKIYTVLDEYGQVMKKTLKLSNTAFDVEDRFGNPLIVGIENDGTAKFYKHIVDNNGERYEAYPQTRNGNTYNLTNLSFKSINLSPVFNDPVEFKIKDLETDVTFINTINEYGYTVFESLIRGHRYEFTETKSTQGFLKTDKVYVVDVPLDKTKNLIIKDKNTGEIITEKSSPVYKDEEGLLYSVTNEGNFNLKLKKVSANNENTKLQDAIFELLDDKGTVISEKATNQEGILEFLKLEGGNTYKLREKQAPNGYLKIDKEYQFKINVDGSINVLNIDDNIVIGNKEDTTLNITIKNKESKTIDLKILKLNENGQKFDLANKDKNLIIKFALLDSSKKLLEEDIIKNVDISTTSTTLGSWKNDLFDNPKNSSQGYSPGLYYLREVTAPEDYIRLSKDIPIYITDNLDIIIPAKKDSSGKFVKDTTLYKDILTVENINTSNIKDYPKTKKLIQLKIKNNKSQFPSVGGYGNIIYILLGLIMIVLGFIGFKRKFKS